MWQRINILSTEYTRLKMIAKVISTPGSADLAVLLAWQCYWIRVGNPGWVAPAYGCNHYLRSTAIRNYIKQIVLISPLSCS